MSKSAEAAVQTFATPDLPVDLIDPDPTQPRKLFDPAALDDLTQSVKAFGVKVPVKVRRAGDRYVLVYGERRLRASKAAGLETIPAIIDNSELTPAETLEEQMAENADREPLNPLDEGAAYKRWQDEFGLTGEQIAEKFGKKKETVYGRMKLAELTGVPRQMVQQGSLLPTIGVLIARMPTPELQEKAFEVVERLADETNGGVIDEVTFRDAQLALSDELNLKLKDAPWKLDDAELSPEAGACSSCPKRTGAQPELFKDVKSDTCLDSACHTVKRKLHAERAAVSVAEKAFAKGLDVLPPEESKKALNSSKFVDLGEVNERDEKRRTWGELMGKKAPAPTIAVDPETGKAHQLVPVEEAAQALKAEGKGKLAPKVNGSDDYFSPENVAKREAEGVERVEQARIKTQAVRSAIAELTTKIAEQKSTPATFLRYLITFIAGAQAPFDRRGISTKEKDFEAALRKMDEGELRGLALEFALGSDAYDVWNGKWNAPLERACEDHGISLKKLEANIVVAEKKEAEEKTKAEKAEAEKKAAAEAAKKKAAEKKPEPKKEAPAKKVDPGVNAKTGKARRMAIREA